MKRLLTFVILASFVLSCESGMSEADVRKLLVKEGAIKPNTPTEKSNVSRARTPAGSLANDTSVNSKKWKQSLDFLARLDKLMDGYSPKPTSIPDDSILQCFTSHELNQDKDLRSFSKTLKGTIKQATNQNKRLETTFRQTTLPLNYRIDYDWQSKMAKKDRNKYLYSNGIEPTMPELMNRITSRNVEVPERIYCKVSDMYTKTRRRSKPVHWVTCNGTTKDGAILEHSSVKLPSEGELLALALTTDKLNVNPGDVISAPLRDATITNGPVLVRGRTGWLMNVDTKTVVVAEKYHKCENQEERLAKIKNKGSELMKEQWDCYNECYKKLSGGSRSGDICRNKNLPKCMRKCVPYRIKNMCF